MREGVTHTHARTHTPTHAHTHTRTHTLPINLLSLRKLRIQQQLCLCLAHTPEEKLVHMNTHIFQHTTRTHEHGLADKDQKGAHYIGLTVLPYPTECSLYIVHPESF